MLIFHIIQNTYRLWLRKIVIEVENKWKKMLILWLQLDMLKMEEYKDGTFIENSQAELPIFWLAGL